MRIERKIEDGVELFHVWSGRERLTHEWCTRDHAAALFAADALQDGLVAAAKALATFPHGTAVHARGDRPRPVQDAVRRQGYAAWLAEHRDDADFTQQLEDKLAAVIGSCILPERVWELFDVLGPHLVAMVKDALLAPEQRSQILAAWDALASYRNEVREAG